MKEIIRTLAEISKKLQGYLLFAAFFLLFVLALFVWLFPRGSFDRIIIGFAELKGEHIFWLGVTFSLLFFSTTIFLLYLAYKSTVPHGAVNQTMQPYKENAESVHPKDSNEIMQARQTLRVPMTELMAKYYKTKLGEKQETYFVKDMPVIFIPELLPEKPWDISRLDGMLSWTKNSPAAVRQSNIDMTSIMRDKKIYDGFIYRILDIQKNQMQFCPGRYFSFLNTCECLSYEISEAMVTNKHYYNILTKSDKPDLEKIVSFLLENENLIPLRSQADPFDYPSRVTAFGTCTLVVIKRTKKSPQLILNKRSPKMGETPDLLHIIPAGTFQPNAPDDRFHEHEFSFTENIIREFVEELLEDHLIRQQHAPNVYNVNDMYGEKGKAFRKEIIKSQNCELVYLGLVIDPINLKPEIHTVLMLHECHLLRACGPELVTSWETHVGTLEFREFSPASLRELLEKTSLVPTGRANLWLALYHFNELSSRLANL